MDEKKLKESFARIKEDMLYLQQELLILRHEILEIKQILQEIPSSTHPKHSTDDFDTFSQESAGIKPYLESSIRNHGVSTDRQQTFDRHKIELKRTSEASEQAEISQESASENTPEKLISIVNQMKIDLKEKFKTLTKQEFLIFSILYTLEEESPNGVTYRKISQRTGLTESSVRDYIARLDKKGVPISKEKINNKTILLKIPRELKDITTLDSLTKLKKF